MAHSAPARHVLKKSIAFLNPFLGISVYDVFVLVYKSLDLRVFEAFIRINKLPGSARCENIDFETKGSTSLSVYGILGAWAQGMFTMIVDLFVTSFDFFIV